MDSADCPLGQRETDTERERETARETSEATMVWDDGSSRGNPID